MGDAIFTDEELMAYADGELPEARAAQLDLALAGDTDLAGRLAIFSETRMLVAAAFEPMLDEPVPDELMRHVRALAARSDRGAALENTGSENIVPDSIAPENVVPLHPGSTTRAPDRQPFWKLPLAAALALAVGLGAGLFMGGERPTPGGLQVAALSDPEISGALAVLASGESRVLSNGSRIALIATFNDNSQSLCREFEYARTGGSTVVSVACRDGTGWEVMLAVTAAPSGDTGYAPASSLETLDAYLTATGAQAPLSARDEARALEGLR